MRKMILFLFAVAMVGWMVAGCSTTPPTGDQKDLRTTAADSYDEFLQNDPSLAKFVESADGYAIFPNVGKGAVGVGGAYGRGAVYEQGTLIGWTDLTQGTIGAQLGGQTYSELIVFQDRRALDNFKSGNFALSAQASAVAAGAGAAATAKFDNGVCVFVRSQSGLMFEASVGGQSFGYRPESQ